MQILFSLLLIMNIVIFHSNIETIFMLWRLWEWIFTFPPLLQRSGRMRWYSAVVFVLLFPHFKLFVVSHKGVFPQDFLCNIWHWLPFTLHIKGDMQNNREQYFSLLQSLACWRSLALQCPLLSLAACPLTTAFPSCTLLCPSLLCCESSLSSSYSLLCCESSPLQQFPIICSAFTALMGNGFPAGLLGKVASASCISNPFIHLWTAIFVIFFKVFMTVKYLSQVQG